MKMKTQQTYQNVWAVPNAVLRRKTIALCDYIKKKEKYKISNVSFHFKKLEKEE